MALPLEQQKVFFTSLLKAEQYMNNYFKIRKIVSGIIDSTIIQPKLEDLGEDKFCIQKEYVNIWNERNCVGRGYCRRAVLQGFQNFDKYKDVLTRLFDVLVVKGNEHSDGYIFKKLSKESFIVIFENGIVLISAKDQEEWIWIYTYFRGILSSVYEKEEDEYFTGDEE